MAARYHHHAPMTVAEEQILLNNRELQTLMEDNQQLAADHVALKQELTLTQQELRRLSSAAASVKTDRDVEVREVYERSVRVAAERGSIEEIRVELEKVLKSVMELKGEVEVLQGEAERVGRDGMDTRRGKEEVEEFMREVEAIKIDILKGRAAIEYEKKIHNSNLEQRQAMERDMISMHKEIGSLRSELAKAEKISKAVAAVSVPGPVHAASSENPSMGYGGSSYPDPSSMNQVNSHANPGLNYGSGAMSNDPFQLMQVQYKSPVMPNGPL